MPRTPALEQTIIGSDNISIEVQIDRNDLVFLYRPARLSAAAQNFFVALNTGTEIGAAVLPFAKHAEGSTVFLPFNADVLLSAEVRGGGATAFIRKWERWRWGDRNPTDAFGLREVNDGVVFRVQRQLLGTAPTVQWVIYAKDPTANDGWGWFWGCSDRTVDGVMPVTPIP